LHARHGYEEDGERVFNFHNFGNLSLKEFYFTNITFINLIKKAMRYFQEKTHALRGFFLFSFVLLKSIFALSFCANQNKIDNI